MSRPALLPLESYRLAQYAVPVPCYICAGDNAFDAELCRHCQAPMAFAHQAAAQQIVPKLVAVVGSAEAGKTVYLGMLTDMLSRRSCDLQIQARGAFSISLQQSTLAALSHGTFPHKTPTEPSRWNWIHSRIQAAKQKESVELIMPDWAGESLAAELDHPHSYPLVRSFLEKSSGVILLLDVARLAAGDEDQDYFAMKTVTYLCELNADPKKGWSNRPLSFVFTKADQCDICFDDPSEFARQYTPGLWKLCQERLRRHRFFAASVVGGCAVKVTRERRSHVPLRVEPRGIVEPFSWLLGQVTLAK